jgi:hypothetical protein
MVHAREEEEVTEAKTTPTEEAILCKELVGITTEDLHIEAQFGGVGSIEANLCTVVVSIFHAPIITWDEHIASIHSYFFFGVSCCLITTYGGGECPQMRHARKKGERIDER